MQRRSRLIATNGTRLHIVEAGVGFPLVFIHGLGWDHHLWSDAFNRYAGRYRVIAGDTRGHGDSDKPPGPYSVRQFADDWRGALDALDVRKACLIGFSQGGMIAMQLAADEPERFIGLFLTSTRCHVDRPSAGTRPDRAAKLREEGPEASARDSAGLIFSADFMAAEPALVDAFVARRAAFPPEPLLAAMQAGEGFDIRQQIANYAGPCTVVAGSADRLTRPEAVREVADTIRGAQFATVDGAGHMVPVEQPARFYALLDEFLDNTGFAAAAL